MKTLSRTARTWLVCAAYLLAGAGALVLLTPYANAQALPSPPTTWPHVPTQNGNTWTYGTGSATAANAGSINFPPPANGPIYTDSTINQPVGGGKSVPVTVRARPAPADIARAMGRFLGRVLPVITTAYAAYQLCQELGYSCGRDANGQPQITGTQTSQRFCSYTPNYNCGEAANGAQFLEQRGCSPAYWNGWQYACGAPFWTGADAQGPATTTTTPKTLQDLENEIASKSGWPSNSKITDALKEAIAAGEPLPLPKPISITGPASVPEAPSVTTFPDGSKVTDQRSKEVAYGPDSVTVTDKSVKTETAPNGVTSPVSTSTSAQPLPEPSTAPAAPDIKTCGYPGGPACKVDETGTPEPLPKGEYSPAAEQYKTRADENRQTIGGDGDKPFFTGWSLFFFAPSIAPCEPMRLPDFGGRPMGQLDACNVVDGTRSVMSYIWALTALFLCLGMIKKVA